MEYRFRGAVEEVVSFGVHINNNAYKWVALFIIKTVATWNNKG